MLAAGYRQADSPLRADIILLNTCSVRQHAEDKIYSALGRLKPTGPGDRKPIIGVLGCMAQKDGQEIFRRAGHVDLVVGPGRLGQLPALLEQVAKHGGPILEVSLDRAGGTAADVRRSFVPLAPQRTPESRTSPHQAMVRILFGCNQFCAYCVVPSVRGPEQSRPAADILEEVRRLADGGTVEVTLLGQTVNSYRDSTGPKAVLLADLLALVNDVAGIRRIKFVTNHPLFMSDELLQAVRDLPKVSPYLHVPAQSGSEAVLRRMKRGYTAAFYREMLARVRQVIPQAAVTSDFIVGFCGETEVEFLQTVDLVRDARFKNSFIFKYSARAGTIAARHYPDDVPEAVKRRRNNELLAVQNAISLEDNRPLLGQTVEVLVEGPSKVARRRRGQGSGVGRIGNPSYSTGQGSGVRGQGPGAELTSDTAVQLVGRTTCDRIVVFDGPERLAGSIVPVVIEQVEAFTLTGRVLTAAAS